MFSFESQFIKTDVTAVKILRKFYLVAVGGYIHVFDKDTYKLIIKINVFEGQKIYEIIPDAKENQILLYGGRYLKVITIDENFTWISSYAYKKFSDWILAAKWIDDYQQIATVSIHNRLQIWNNDLELITEVNSEEKCILYSAFICGHKFKELVILSGTVFSEVLIWRPDQKKESSVLKRLQRHKGVIFSVHYNAVSNYICSSSDDRSAVLWKPKHENLLAELNQEKIEINISCQVFGHLSRIFRCYVLRECFLTAGEDSLLNMWSFDGLLIRKIETNQGGPVWAIDANENDNFILTGSSDCSATLFPIHSNFEEQELSIPDKEVPRNVSNLANNNFVVVSETGVLYYYTKKRQEWMQVQKYDGLKSYAIVAVSKCRNLVALAGFFGQIYVYKQENDVLHEIISFTSKSKSRIFSLHWIDCKTFSICQAEGVMTLYVLKNNNVVPLSNFILPPSKERWSNAAVSLEKIFVVGDRKGNLHLFEFGKLQAVQTLKKVHSHLGVTNLVKENNKIMSLGRNATVKIFTLHNGRLHLNSSNKVPFTWLVDITGDLLVAFSGNNFVLWNHRTKRIIFEKSCGGGHRSWDFQRTDSNAVFSYIKDKTVHVVDLILNKFSPVDLIEGYQVKEINSVEVVNVSGNYIVVSGGEDTTLRINLLIDNNFSSIVSLKPHLSSIRTITTYKVTQKETAGQETYLVFSGGGRAQIICWKLEIFTKGNSVNDIACSEQHSYYKIIDSEESEMRIMDLVVITVQNQLLLFAACSDGNVKIFFIDASFGQYHLTFYRDVFYKLRCILKLCNIQIFGYDIFVTMATDGQLVFWDMSDICKNESEVKWFHSIQSHQSGVNSYDFKLLKDGLCLFLTGGDDNAIVLNLIRFQKTKTVTIENIDVFMDSGTHCAQITGVFLSNKYFLTASIDQRVAIFEWQLLDEKLNCKYITKYNTAVADLQGLCCFVNNDFDAFMYGKGIEYIKIRES